MARTLVEVSEMVGVGTYGREQEGGASSALAWPEAWVVVGAAGGCSPAGPSPLRPSMPASRQASLCSQGLLGVWGWHRAGLWDALSGGGVSDIPVAWNTLMLRHLTFIIHVTLRAIVEEEAEVQRGLLYLPTVVGGRAGTLQIWGELGGG